jgi:tRNA/tmRNA/rRNA uracil-C5-methylase (TrmA/RlmC/RlmD family)
MSPAEYSRWGKCQLPAYEIERQIREKREEEQRKKKQKEKEKKTRQILKEKKMELRPQCPPPHNMNHRAEVPCEHCTPSIPKEKPTYPTEIQTGPICPNMDRMISKMKNIKSLELKGGVIIPDCNCIYDGLQDCCMRTARK